MQASPGLPVRKRRGGRRFLLAAALLYGGLWLLMDVGFIAHYFPSPFLTGPAYYSRYSRFVGGPVQYLANLFGQAYGRQWAGVLAFSLLALAAWMIARGILRRFSPGSFDWPAAALPLVMLMLASRYLAVVYILPMAAGLAAAWLYMRLGDRPRDRRAEAGVVLFLVASVPLYWVLASGFLFLSVMCALYEGLVRRRPAWSVVWVAFGAAVPFGMSYVYYEPDIAARYLRWISVPPRDLLSTALAAAMYLFVPVGAVVAFSIGRFRVRDRLAPRLLTAARVAGFAALALLASGLVALRFDRSGWIYADYLRESGSPEDALASLAQSPDDRDPARFLALYALSRTGRLPWEMFRYPQVASSDALLLRDTKWDRISVVADWRSDLYLELGRVNDSQRWAHEALAMEGETPRVLERIALTYILSGNPDAARTFVLALEKAPFQAARARRYLAALDADPGMHSDPLVARIRPLMLRKDYVGDFGTEQILQQCLDANPSNRTAFEYLLAHYLLTFDMNGLVSVAPRLKDFYGQLPTHVQEALLGFRNLNGTLPPGVDGSMIDRGIESRFQGFVDAWTRLQHGAAEDAWKALAPSYGETYWFFFIFGRTAAGPPFEARADAPRRTGGAQ